MRRILALLALLFAATIMANEANAQVLFEYRGKNFRGGFFVPPVSPYHPPRHYHPPPAYYGPPVYYYPVPPPVYYYPAPPPVVYYPRPCGWVWDPFWRRNEWRCW